MVAAEVHDVVEGGAVLALDLENAQTEDAAEVGELRGGCAY